MEKDKMKEAFKEALVEYMDEVYRSVGKASLKGLAVVGVLIILFVAFKMGILNKIV